MNTGNIAAFVNEDVSGVLSYTVEEKTNTWDADCIKLTADEVDVMKAGAYLAGAFNQSTGNALAGVTSGDIAEYFNNGAGTDPKTTDDFTPTAAGLYFFRRSIAVNTTNQSETFKYEGYYFNGSDYYKLASIAINEVPTGTAGDGITTDGNLSKCPTVMYSKDKSETVTPTLAYDATRNRLVATYNIGGVGATAAQATAVDNADKAVTDATGALAELNAKKAALDTAETTYQTAVGTYNAALTTIAYYAGQTNAKTITEITGFTYVDGSTAVGSASTLTLGSIVSPGILYQEITDYNTLVGQFNGLASQISTAEAAQTTANGELTTANGNVTTTLATFNSAKTAYNSELGQDYDADIAAIGTPSSTDSIYTVWAAEQAYNAAIATAAEKQTAYDDATNALNDLNNQAASLRTQLIALGNTINTNVAALNAAINTRTTNTNAASSAVGSDYATAKENYENALAAYETALANYNAARAEYEAADNTGSDIVIYINLSNDVVTNTTVADKWQLIPIVSGAAADTTAHFYYTGILEAGESSAKLIDSVELADTVTQDAYKSFDFDLNVNLDSAQITYADDQKTIIADAANTPAFESRQANLTTPTSLDTAVLWS